MTLRSYSKFVTVSLANLVQCIDLMSNKSDTELQTDNKIVLIFFFLHKAILFLPHAHLA